MYLDKMSYECKKNKWVQDGFAVFFQVVFIFAFLTVFFFIYVVKIEKEEFENQMNLIADNIFSDENLNTIIPKTGDVNTESIILSGLIDTAIEKIKADGSGSSKDVANKNTIIRNKSFKILLIVVSVLTALSALFLVLGFCIPILYEIKEALWIVFFVGLTELTFLTVIAKNYISADPNKVKRILGKSIQDWITNCKSCSPSP
jgi:hypothetical protein